MDLIDKILQADPRAMARAMSLIENQDPQARDILKALFPKTGRALVIGVTGAAGTGKSTLVDKLAQEFRRQSKTVGIIAVDPTSPFSGGAILADRVRMSALYNDEGVFIRSMATRGHLGGLSRTAAQILSVLDAAGKEIILLETVGVGQDEVEIVKVADVSLVVLVPGMGDDVQAFKAGIMEIGDIFVLNKADHPQVERAEKELQSALSLAVRSDGWSPLTVRTIATQPQGIEDLIGHIEEFDRYRQTARELVDRRKASVERELMEILKETLLEKAIRENGVCDKIQAASKAVRERRVDPYTAVEEIVRDLL
ncbi:MAG: methylmalonyl Co-A mutase-associated GTPase MeaB [Acidobacteria bacterium]|nr:methylmalonyl Co-A mutase-associated GTPase MeaB [Acidobacteriota bacterium]MCI0719310.1 methylmalonyl Co-A mutase-associated GTPase MeaB [Acidobacteriota bacterium]